MHELSIVLSIIDTASDACLNAGKEQIDRIELEIGQLAGIDQAALNFAWDAATRNTVLENAERNVIHIEAKGKCLECNTSFSMKELYDTCPQCGSYFNTIDQGKELKIKAIYAS